jgi:hypothetical protein
VSTSTPQAGSEEREDGEVPGLLAAEALCPAQRVHLLEQVELQPFALELGDALAEEQRSRSSRTASVSDLYRSAQSMAREESSETRQEIQDRLHATAESAEERKRSRTDAAWKAKKTQQRKAIVEAGLPQRDAAGHQVLFLDPLLQQQPTPRSGSAGAASAPRTRRGRHH